MTKLSETCNEPLIGVLAFSQDKDMMFLRVADLSTKRAAGLVHAKQNSVSLVPAKQNSVERIQTRPKIFPAGFMRNRKLARKYQKE